MVSDDDATHNIEFLPEAQLPSRHRDFIDHWSEQFFGQQSPADTEEAPVHWRCILSKGDTAVAHVAVTDLVIERDGYRDTYGAIGGLFTVPEYQGQGFATAVMKAAEEFVLVRQNRNAGILFCLEELVTFYRSRDWIRTSEGVTLQQVNGVVTWPHEVMILPKPGIEWRGGTLHVPRCDSRPDGTV